MKERIMYSTEPTWYTVIHRRNGERRAYRCGLRSRSLDDMRDFAKMEAESGRYTMVKIVHWSTEETIEVVKGSGR